MNDYTDTAGAIARKAGVSVPTVNVYAELGLVDCIRASNGWRLFKPSAADRVREVRDKRLANRGGRRRA